LKIDNQDIYKLHEYYKLTYELPVTGINNVYFLRLINFQNKKLGIYRVNIYLNLYFSSTTVL